MSSHLVAVYGTLKKGFHNHHYLIGSKLLGSGVTKHDHYVMLSAGIPYVCKCVDEEKMGRISVEVYEVDDNTLKNLDRLEGHPEWYKREPVYVDIEGVGSLAAWLYFNEGALGKVNYHDFRDERKCYVYSK